MPELQLAVSATTRARRACHGERGRDRRATRAREDAAQPGGRVRPHDRQRRSRPRSCRAGRDRSETTLSYHVATVIHPRIDQLLENVDQRYALVIVAAK